MSTCPLNNRECRCDPKDEKRRPCALARRIGQLIRLQASSFEAEALNATRRLRQLLPAEGISFNNISVLIENSNGEIEQLKYSDSDAEAIFTRGVEEGRKQGAGHALSPQYFDADGEPRWGEIARFCQSDPGKTSLKPNEQEFVDEILVKLRWRTPTRPTGGYLLSIFWKLGGSFK
jgi:hypothetical protein